MTACFQEDAERPRSQVVVENRVRCPSRAQRNQLHSVEKTPNMRETKVVFIQGVQRGGYPRHGVRRPCLQTKRGYLVKARMILADMWRKKIEAMKERERTSTMKGSLRGKQKRQDSHTL